MEMEQKHTATLNLDNGSQPLEFPLMSGSMGPDVVDIRTLHAKSGVFTYDPGFLSTASCSSKITFIDGDKGILLYRGYAMDISDASHRELSAFRLVAKLPTITAMTYKYNIGQPFIYPRNNLSYAENFMHMMFATPAEEYKPNPVLARALDRILILHADHE